MEEKLFDLLEAKAFNELIEAEEKFVLKNVSKEEYLFQRNVILGLSEIESKVMLATPLSFSKDKKSRTVPLWQVLVGAAALILGFVMIYPKLTVFSKNNFANETVVADTLFVKKTDTIYLPSKQSQAKFIYQTDTIQIVEKIYLDKEKLNKNLTNVTINKSISTEGTSLKDDRDLGWVPKQIAL